MDANAAHFDARHDDVFTRIAGRYDLLCDLFSLGIHRLWKRRMAQRIAGLPWQTMVDVAAGTGDIALRVARRTELNANRQCLVTDICPAMLSLAARKGQRTPLTFKVMNAHDLAELPTASVDLYASSLGMKICDRALAIKEALRVLKPGGTFICLEASRIRPEALHQLYLLYMRACMPIVGWAATGGDASAYAYLLRGVSEFPSPAEFARELADTGFAEVRYELLTLGVVAIHSATKPA
jgi:ubiquinone/menaquinone biosynthesis methyltransferase